MKRVYTLAAFVFLLGATTGTVLTYIYMGHVIANALFLLKAGDILRSEESSIDAYFNRDAEIAIWALEEHVATLHKSLSEGYPEDELVLDFILAHARLAKTWGTIGNQDRESENVEEALNWASSKTSSWGRIKTRKELASLLENFDSSVRSINSNDL